ncbi:hypothetical protein EMPS_10721 [Entomortierella parvispora]|uniref:non-specific serine/threonine protein kinase n=1 Tax=Entomortierella parvispora TaxID=205924 RepID=A0A9P3HLF5_9FUNG|nr:hypothetical protein EMPS_10721 [Entomortierella parvispora]
MSSHLSQNAHPDAGYTLDSTSSTANYTSNGFTSHSPVLPVLSPSQIRQLGQQCMHERVQPQVPQQQQQQMQQSQPEELRQQHRQQQHHMQQSQLQDPQQQSQPQQMQQEQQGQHPPRPMTLEEIAMAEFDRETEEAVADLRRKRSKERAHKKLSMRMEYLHDAQEQALQAMAEMNPTAKASITTTITTVSPSAPDSTSSKLTVTTTATTTMGSVQVSQTEVSSSVADPVMFENNTSSRRQTPARRASMPPLRIDTQSTSPPRTVVAPSSLETLVDTPHFGMLSSALSPAAFPFSSPVPALDKKTGIVCERDALPSAGARSSLSPNSYYENHSSTAIAVVSPTSAHSSGAKTVHSRKRKTTDVAAYKLGDCLGRGGSAEVYKCKSNEDQKEYAIRIIPMKAVGDKIADEVALMKKLCHPNIIEFKDFLHYKNLEWYMILELCKGELMKLQDNGKTDKVFCESECRDYFHQLLMGIEYHYQFTDDPRLPVLSPSSIAQQIRHDTDPLQRNRETPVSSMSSGEIFFEQFMKERLQLLQEELEKFDRQRDEQRKMLLEEFDRDTLEKRNAEKERLQGKRQTIEDELASYKTYLQTMALNQRDTPAAAALAVPVSSKAAMSGSYQNALASPKSPPPLPPKPSSLARPSPHAVSTASTSARRHINLSASSADHHEEDSAEPQEMGTQPSFDSKGSHSFSSLDSKPEPEIRMVNIKTVNRVGDYMYSTHDYLGVGGSAKVYKARNITDGRDYAIREIMIASHSDHDTESMKEEVAMMKKLDHPNIIKVYEVMSCSFPPCWYMVHEHGVAHRDIKPGNILISHDGKLKIADFGISQRFATGETLTIINNRHGTAGFMAPETNQEVYSGRRADIWSMGVTLFLMWNGQIPFSVSKRGRPLSLASHVEFKAGTPEPLKALLNRMLEVDPNQRVTMDQLRQDPWVTDNGRMQLAKSKEDNVGGRIEVTDDDRARSLNTMAVVAKAASIFGRTLSRSRNRVASPTAAGSSSGGEVDIEAASGRGEQFITCLSEVDHATDI